MKLKLKELVGKIACKSTDARIRRGDGQYPRIGWIHESGFKINKTYYRYVNIDESPHYQFVLDRQEAYSEYMNTSGWRSGRKDAIDRFQRLIQEFGEYDHNIKYIEVVKENNVYAIVDGLHRCSILFSRDPEMEVEVKVLVCPGFTNLPMHKK